MKEIQKNQRKWKYIDDNRVYRKKLQQGDIIVIAKKFNMNYDYLSQILRGKAPLKEELRVFIDQLYQSRVDFGLINPNENEL
ncbi:MAG: hypothetical protein JEY96_00805 [Bacteroidales bacterium]|nr:hypothetical protein [Bacteroidales bacterium]